MSKFLNLAAFIALLLGCIGIASSVNIYIKEKLKAVAVLKCMGTSRKQSFLIFLIQISAIGIIGGFLGSLIGIVLQELFPYLLKEFLPFDMQVSIAFKPLLMGVLLGFLCRYYLHYYHLYVPGMFRLWRYCASVVLLK